MMGKRHNGDKKHHCKCDQSPPCRSEKHPQSDDIFRHMAVLAPRCPDSTPHDEASRRTPGWPRSSNVRYMKAAVYTKYGPPDVLQIKDVPTPDPGNDDVRVRVHAATVCTPDWRLRKGDPFPIRFVNGPWRPKKLQVLGMEFA